VNESDPKQKKAAGCCWWRARITRGRELHKPKLCPHKLEIAGGTHDVAQIGVHLVCFLHIATGPDNPNNVLALAFGLLIVTLVTAGSLWITTNPDADMMPSAELMNLQMQHWAASAIIAPGTRTVLWAVSASEIRSGMDWDAGRCTRMPRRFAQQAASFFLCRILSADVPRAARPLSICSAHSSQLGCCAA
jgi:hypothetical protein